MPNSFENFKLREGSTSEHSDRAQLVAGVDSFDKARLLVRELGGVQGSQKFHSAEEIIQKLNDIEAGNVVRVHEIPETDGWRSKIRELLKNEFSSGQ